MGRGLGSVHGRGSAGILGLFVGLLGRVCLAPRPGLTGGGGAGRWAGRCESVRILSPSSPGRLYRSARDPPSGRASPFRQAGQQLGSRAQLQDKNQVPGAEVGGV